MSGDIVVCSAYMSAADYVLGKNRFISNGHSITHTVVVSAAAAAARRRQRLLDGTRRRPVLLVPK